MTFSSVFRVVCSGAFSVAMALTLVPCSAIAAFASDDGIRVMENTDGDTSQGDGDGQSDGDVPSTEPVATYTVTYQDGANGKAFSSQVTSGLASGANTPAFSGTPHRSGYTFGGWSPQVSKTVSGDAVYTATWLKNITKAEKVVPYLTVKAKYKGGKLSAVKKNVKAGTTVKTSNEKSGKYLVSLSFKVDASNQRLDPTLKSKYTIGVKYRVLAGGKWSAWKKDGAAAGGNSRIEAFQVKLTGKVAKYYTIYSRAQLRYCGLMDWASGTACGTSGYGYRDLTGLQVVIKKKNAKAPGSQTLSFLTSKTTTMSYTLKNAKGKKVKASKLGATAGRATKKALKGVTIAVASKGLSGSVKYAVNQNGTWSSAVSKGLAGSKSKKKSLRAIKISLSGNLKKYYDVYYRVRLKEYGKWLGWAKNGSAAGTTAYDFHIVAYQVKLVLKGADAPGATAGSFCSSGGFLSDIAYKQTLENKAKNLSSKTNYLLVVDTNTCRVGIFQGKKGHWKMIKYWLAGVGALTSDTQTKKGNFTVCGREYVFGTEKGYNCWYATQFYGNYLFHSEVYDIGYKDAAHMQSGGLGTHVSHGCVRLAIKNAKWLYDRYDSFYGSTVKVY